MAQRLTSQQERAIDLLVAGRRDSEVVAELAINRTTLWRWRTDDPVFQAALNARRVEARNAATEELRSLVPHALQALSEELSGPRRLRAALAILELAGFRARRKAGLDLQPAGPITPEGVEAEREKSAALDEMFAGLGLPGYP